MLRIKKITIENFRGIRLPIVLDFVKGGNYTSALIYGRNATGKSSIVDAWEWLSSFEIQPLSREGVSIADFPHRASNGINSYISVEFDHSSITNVKVEFNKNRITTPNLTGKYSEYNQISAYPNYLRYSDLQSFVYKTKAERYKYIAKFFGLEKLSILQDTIQTAFNKQSLKLIDYNNRLNANNDAIVKITKVKPIDEQNIVNFINSIGTKHGIPAIIKFIDADKVKTALKEIVQTNPVAKELSEWKAFQLKQNQFYPIPTVKQSCAEVENLFTDLKQNEETIKQLILSELYKLSIEVLPKLEDKTKCPVCDNIYEGDLLKHIQEKHSTLDELNKSKNKFDERKSTLEKQFDKLAKKTTVIQSENSSNILILLKPFFDDLEAINNGLPSIVATLRKELKDLQELKISSEIAISKIDDIISNYEPRYFAS